MNPQLELLLKIQSIETKIIGYENEKKKLHILCIGRDKIGHDFRNYFLKCKKT